MKFSFRFPRVDAEVIVTEGTTYGEAADKAILERTQHVTPLKADGELYDEKASLTKPTGRIANA